MRKISVISVILGTMFFLFACGDGENEKSPSSRAKTITDEMSELHEDEAVSSGRIDIGEQISTEHGTFTLLKRTSDMQESGTEPINVFVDRVAAFKGDVAGSFVEILDKEVINFIQVNMIAENTTEEILSFPLLKTKLMTDSGEEVNGVDMLMSDFVQDEIRSKVRMNGSFVFILEDTDAEDVESIRLIWDAPENEAGEKQGKPVEIEIEF